MAEAARSDVYAHPERARFVGKGVHVVVPAPVRWLFPRRTVATPEWIITGRRSDDPTLEPVLRADWRAAALEPRLRAILEYAAKLMLTPALVGPENVPRLRAVGLDDRAILDVAQVTAYFNFVNRLSHGLGVKLEALASRGDPTRWV